MHSAFPIHCLNTVHCAYNFLWSLLALVFTALHRMQTWSSDENSVCLSVCPSVKRVNCDKTGEKSVKIFTLYERSFSLVFWEEEWLVGQTLLPEILGQPALAAISPIFELIYARSASVITPSKKVPLKLTGSWIFVFQWAQDDHRMLPLSPQRGSKTRTADFCIKSHFTWRKFATKFLCVKTVSDSVVRQSVA